MVLKLLAITAAAALTGAPALAQSVAASTAGPVLSLPAEPAADPTPPVTLPPDAAATGEPANVTERANRGAVAPTLADLTPGARVYDPAGEELGQVVGVVTPKRHQTHQAFVTLQKDGVTVALPISSFTLAGGALTASESRAEVWGQP